MRIEERIHTQLREAFSPSRLEVVNDSHRHAGHAGDDGSGESHFSVVIRSDRFAGQTRLQRHRAVHAALGAELVQSIHALALDIDI